MPAMTEEDVKKAIADAVGEKTKMDAENGEKLDKLLSHLDSFGKRMDAMEEGEAKRVAADKSKADAEEEEGKSKEKMDAEEEEKKAKEKADAEEEEKKAKEKADAEEKERMEKEKSDSDIKARIADVESRLPVQITDADYRVLTDAQAAADVVFQAFGDSAPRPLNGETPLSYRRRLATALKVHSQDWKGVDLNAIADETAFNIAEKRIYADSMNAALNPIDIPEGTMRPITSVDRVTGHRVTRFAGKRSFVRDFTSVNRHVTAINTRQRERDAG